MFILVPSFVQAGDADPVLPAGTPTYVWRPRNLKEADLFIGTTTPGGQPKDNLFKFKEENLAGGNPKIKVSDNEGVSWSMKFGREVHSEVAANRLVWALGYQATPTFFYPVANLRGDLSKPFKRIPICKTDRKPSDSCLDPVKGLAYNIEIKRKHKKPEDDGSLHFEAGWNWTSNALQNTVEMQALALFNVMIQDWDSTNINNSKIALKKPYSNGYELWLFIGDLGESFGSSYGKTNWDLHAYDGVSFINEAKGGTIKTNYSPAAHSNAGFTHDEMPREAGEFLLSVLKPLTDAQIHDAFAAAYGTKDLSPEDSATVNGFTKAFRKKINELSNKLKWGGWGF